LATVFLFFDDLLVVGCSLSTMAERFFFCRLDLVVESCLPVFAVDREVAVVRFEDGSAILFFVLGMTFWYYRTVCTTTLKQPMNVLTVAHVQTLINVLLTLITAHYTCVAPPLTWFKYAM